MGRCRCATRWFVGTPGDVPGFVARSRVRLAADDHVPDTEVVEVVDDLRLAPELHRCPRRPLASGGRRGVQADLPGAPSGVWPVSSSRVCAAICPVASTSSPRSSPARGSRPRRRPVVARGCRQPPASWPLREAAAASRLVQPRHRGRPTAAGQPHPVWMAAAAPSSGIRHPPEPPPGDRVRHLPAQRLDSPAGTGTCRTSAANRSPSASTADPACGSRTDGARRTPDHQQSCTHGA